MIDVGRYYALLRELDFDFFTGVPDSLLKHLCSCISDRAGPGEDIITANEGAAVALAAGHYLATGRAGVVYLQNSGLGNTINPLLSLADRDVYGIPMLLIVGWRGEPERPDEPQHLKQGRVTRPLLEAMEIPSAVHPETLEESRLVLEHIRGYLDRDSGPYVLIVPKGTFAAYESERVPPAPHSLSRAEAVAAVVSSLEPADVVVATTGKAARELFALREREGRSHDGDFLMVGSMGHASQIALGIALARRDRRVVCLDGDGAVLMHMGSLAVVASRGPANLTHVVLNNGVHDSVGGQPTVGFEIDLPAIARGCGYASARSVSTRPEIRTALNETAGVGPALVEIRVNPGARQDLGRPTGSPAERKIAFMRHLGVVDGA